jgi:hypothetical protein
MIITIDQPAPVTIANLQEGDLAIIPTDHPKLVYMKLPLSRDHLNIPEHCIPVVSIGIISPQDTAIRLPSDHLRLQIGIIKAIPFDIPVKRVVIKTVLAEHD